MSPEDILDRFAQQVGFEVQQEPDIVRLVRVPCLYSGRLPGTCTIETSIDPATSKPDGRISSGAVHAVRVTIDEEHDGLVYSASGVHIGNPIAGDQKTWCCISIHKGAPGQPEPEENPHGLLHRYAKRIVGAVAAAGYPELGALSVPSPFHILNTFEARAAIAPVQDRIRGQRVAIVGLGGTGAYILDLIAKTPVSEIHLLDADFVEWHNLMRAPSAPTNDEIELVRSGELLKVEYYSSKYAALRDGILPHPVRVDSETGFAEFVAEHCINFVFICIDQTTEGNSARQDTVYQSVSASGVPFIDSGVSITLDHDQIAGSITTSAFCGGSGMWATVIPNARLRGDVSGYRNTQLPEVNAAAATFAVMEWRRRTGQYAPESASFLHKFRLETGRVQYA